MIANLLLLAIAGLGALYLTRKPLDAVRTSGAVTLHTAVPYRFELLWPRSAGNFNPSVTTSVLTLAQTLVARGMSTPEMVETPEGMLIHFRATPTIPTPVTLGAVVFGPSVLRSIVRMDGKDWDAS